jgi:hypothetical protein
VVAPRERSALPVRPGATTLPGPPNRPGGATGRLAEFFEATPGRLRTVALLVCAAHLVLAVAAAWTMRAGEQALSRARQDSAQVVLAQTITADLLRADAAATSAFLVAGTERPEQRAEYQAAMRAVSDGVARAAAAQPMDGKALAQLNTVVVDYGQLVGQARADNRMALVVGAAYQRQASALLRSRALPILQAVVTANQARAEAEFDWPARQSVILALVGCLTLAVSGWAWVTVALLTRRRLNIGLVAAGGLCVLTLAAGLGALAQSSWAVAEARDHYRVNSALALALAQTYNARSYESLTLIERGSGWDYERAWTVAVQTTHDALAEAGADRTALTGYQSWHRQVRALDDDGQWNDAVAMATDPSEQPFSVLVTQLRELGTDDAGLNPVDHSRIVLTWAGWLLPGLCLLAVPATTRGLAPRLAEYQ